MFGDGALAFKIIEFDPAVKITLKRPRGSGAVGETDGYGAQPHVPVIKDVP